MGCAYVSVGEREREIVTQASGYFCSVDEHLKANNDSEDKKLTENQSKFMK